LANASSANYNNGNTKGTDKADSSLDATATPILSFASTGAGPNSHSLDISAAATGAVAGYTLANSDVLSMKGSSLGATDQFTVASRFTARAIPEPASLVMMLTGMPLPLVVLGLLRRRRAAA
jgi:hypothetical protein